MTLSPQPPLSPLGTARLRLDDGRGAAPSATGAAPSAAAIAPPPALRHALDLDAHDAFVAAEVAGWALHLGAADRAALAAIVARLLAEVGQGSTRIVVPPSDQAVLARAPDLVGPPGAATPLILTDGRLTLHRLHAAETRLAVALGHRFDTAAAPPLFSPAAVEAALAAVCTTALPTPSAEQRQAVKAALASRLGIITGGPGTGKTTIVLALVRTLVGLGVAPADIALAAPTGKAANRLGEALRAGLAQPRDQPRDELAFAPPEPETLHRLLRHSPTLRAFAHGEGAPLPHRVVIVDESSMIDLTLMDRLLASLSPTTTLILLGDADQLPSVEAGTVFRDIAARGVQLTQSHRMDPARPEGRRILSLAAAVRSGQQDFAGLIDVRVRPADLAFTATELYAPTAAADPDAALDAFLTRWFDQHVRPSSAFTALARQSFPLRPRADAAGPSSPSDVAARFEAAAIDLFETAFTESQSHRLLAVTRARSTGVDAINAALHARWAGRSRAPVAGEPVMMLRNDYQRGLWNGDQGMVITVRDPHPRQVALFKVADVWTPFALESLRDALSLALVLTVHKAQGSEYDQIGLVLPHTPSPLLTRDLLYTAITRSRRGVVICGSPAMLALGAGTASRRPSALADLSTASAADAGDAPKTTSSPPF